MEIIKRENRVIYKVSGETISIPSRMYPLESDSFQCFDADNTSEIVDEKIIAIFDSIKPEAGRCKSEDFAKLDSMTKIYKTKDEAREYIAEYILQKEQLPNHQRCIFGVVDKMYHYIGAPGTREDGIKRNKELRKIYPQHPCFQDVKNGITRGQEILLRKK